MMDFSQFSKVKETKDEIISQSDNDAISNIINDAISGITVLSDQLSFTEHLQTLLLSIRIDKFLIEGQDNYQTLNNAKIASDILKQKEREIKATIEKLKKEEQEAKSTK